MMPLAETGALGPGGTLLAAPFLGFAFGWWLERGGLGNPRKLAGQFYFADFTVFKVMFSALLTAMLGAFWLDRFGWLDLTLVYLPETFVLPQLAGGVVFGAGFLLAGLCPGTSCVAAAAGRRDGLAVVGGVLFGVLLFNVGYSQMSAFHNSTALGAVALNDLLRTSRGATVALVTGTALACFAVIARREAAAPRRRRLAVSALVLGLGAAAADLGPADQRSLAAEIDAERDHMSAPDLADLIIAGDRSLRIYDLRATTDYDRMHIPSARHATLDALANETFPRDATIVLYSEGGAHAAQAWVLVRMRGHRRVFFLREGMFEWLARVIEPRLPENPSAAERAEFDRALPSSRFFGGRAQEGVPRAEVPVGYWNSGTEPGAPAPSTSAAPPPPSSKAIVSRMRRRGC